jgi:hypothetical protein
MSICLGELFSCTEQGGAFVAEAADGQLLHIDEVPSGLACNCVCPGCGRRMVAKKGDVQVHHFAHYAQQDGRSCVSAGETALHKFAKRILDERLEIGLPAHVLEDGDDREVVVQAEKRAFDRAILETKDGQIVPDVVLLLRERRLIVEFKVTHPCDEQKIARIRTMDVGAIEIDLSQYRDHTLSEIGDQILYDAPRTWLHNPRERQARVRLEDRARQRAEEKRTQVEQHRNSYRHRSPSKAAGSGACETAAREDGLGDLINLPVDGAGCFTVAVAEWQAAVLQALLAATKPPFRTRNGLSILRTRQWLDPSFADISGGVASGMRKIGIPFNSPFEAVEAYLKQLQQLGFVHSGPTEIWRASNALQARIDEVRELRARPVKRQRELRHMVDEMIADLPEDEKRFSSSRTGGIQSFRDCPADGRASPSSSGATTCGVSTASRSTRAGNRSGRFRLRTRRMPRGLRRGPAPRLCSRPSQKAGKRKLSERTSRRPSAKCAAEARRIAASGRQLSGERKSP